MPRQYKDVILGLVFLKYVSDAFDERREQIRAELARRRDTTTTRSPSSSTTPTSTPARRLLGAARRALGVPRRERQGHGRDRRRREADRPADRRGDGRRHERQPAASTATLPRIFNRDNVDQRRLGELHRPVQQRRGSPARARQQRARDLLGEVYEYFLEKFAAPRASGAASSTRRPASCGCSSRCWSRRTGGCTTRAAGRAACSCRPRSSSRRTTATRSDISVYGQELNERTWRMAKMNLAIHGLERQPRPALGRHVRPRPAPRRCRPTS